MTRTYALSDFDFELPTHLIAQFPSEKRTQSRLLIPQQRLGRLSGFEERSFSEIINSFNAGDVLVLNNTKVIPARLQAQKESGGKLEVFVERITEGRRALCMIRANRAPKPGTVIHFAGHQASVIKKQGQFYSLVLLNGEWLEVLEAQGEVPLPPYINRQFGETDKERYQTVYAKESGAVAAPTAGLHFDSELLKALKNKGVSIAEVTLHVGAGTFLPIKSEDIEAHEMHFELFSISDRTALLVNEAKRSGHRITAVGTTSLRALESAVDVTGKLIAGQGDTNIFIRPGFNFSLVDRLITNFHLPKSSLMLLVSAFSGYDFIRQTYAYAIDKEYRFFSYGDAMLLERIVA